LLLLLLLVVQAAAALRLSPRPAWLSSFQAASQPKLVHLNPKQLAAMAAALAATIATAAAAGASPSAAAAGAQAAKGVRLSPAWLKSWMECAQQQLQQLTAALQQKGSSQISDTAADATSNQPPAAAAGFGASAASSGAAIGQLAVASVQLGALQPPVTADVSKPGFSGGPLGPGPAESDRLAFAAALVAAAVAAGSASTAAGGSVLDATSASDIAFALTELKVQQPGLVLKLQDAAKSKSKLAAGLSVAGSLAAVAAAAGGSMSGSSSSVLMRLVRGVVAAEAQPGGQFDNAVVLFCQILLMSHCQNVICIRAMLEWPASCLCFEQGGAQCNAVVSDGRHH
jgi:hypothetical protein